MSFKIDDLPELTDSLKEIADIYRPLGFGFKIWRYVEDLKLKAYLKAASKKAGGEDKVHEKLKDAMHKPRTREFVAHLMERMRKAESVWATYCLGILLGKTLNDDQLEIHELIIADILARLDDNDLNFLCRLRDFVSIKQAEQKVDKNSKSFRIEEDDLKLIEFADKDGLLLTRMRVDRLTFSGVFSGDIGGYGNSGFAHGCFVWHDLTEKFYQFISENKIEVDWN